ncbi:hypothetical protein PHLCEN_2v225 [Hermanssonia centrifuga]|uniref:Uncharacterized protein n=1 Tax=Hermanssonia centrifuga TaxID=98765 RepID=A0A2R6S6R1_9APHY|nr:hypothetical protein PHLCEN_2v225 [Hermanssonia centrifuga]
MSSSELGTEGTTVNQVTSMTSVHIKAVTTTEQFTDANWAVRSGTPKVLDQEEV